jgi:hypothetical protein
VLACDGIWDVMSNQDTVSFVGLSLEQFGLESGVPNYESILPAICDNILLECLKRGTKDNMSILVIALRPIADLLISPNSASTRSKLTSRALNFDSPPSSPIAEKSAMSTEDAGIFVRLMDEKVDGNEFDDDSNNASRISAVQKLHF